MQKNGIVLYRLKLTFGVFSFFLITSILLSFSVSTRLQLCLVQKQRKVEQLVFYLKVTTVFCLVLLLNFVARFVISMWI